MEIKSSPLGFLIYSAIASYALGFLPALLGGAIRFQKHLRAMGRRLIVLGFSLCVAGCLLTAFAAAGWWIKYHELASEETRKAVRDLVRTALRDSVLVFAGFSLLGLATIGVALGLRALLRDDPQLLRRLTASLRAATAICAAVAGVCIAVAYALRWHDVRHVPMQNLFEVFLTLGVLAIPISLFCYRFFGIQSWATDLLLGAAVLFPAGFVFDAEPQQLPPALQCWLFAPHVAVYMLSYMIMAKATVQAGFQLWTHGLMEDKLEYEHATYNMVRVGFPLLTLGLILGSWWGKLAWGRYWGWDPKELWSLASWLVYLGYFHWRYMYGKRYPRINSLWAIAGMLAIIITLLWVNLSKLFPGLHSYAT